MGCPVCGEEDCVRHCSVLAFARLLNACVFVGLALLIGLIAVALAVKATTATAERIAA